tara:strand:+ start:547 stop:744 length:198 start_codon:yes stop_codon:yes gene_type:complete
MKYSITLYLDGGEKTHSHMMTRKEVNAWIIGYSKGKQNKNYFLIFDDNDNDITYQWLRSMGGNRR